MIRRFTVKNRCGLLAGWLVCGALAIANAQTYLPGQAYFGRSNYVEYIAGDMPLIFSAPHGGALTPAEIPDRQDDGSDPNYTTVTDSNTEQLAQTVQQVFCNYFGHSPHIIICQLKRTKIDCNRSLAQGVYQTNAYATQAWNEFQNYIAAGSNTAVAPGGRGFYIDLHGQGHPIQRLELGYLLTATQLTYSDTTLNQPVYASETGVRSLSSIVAANPGMTFAQLLRGSNSFGALMAARGFPSVPSPAMPSPGNGTNPVVYPGDQNPYFDGGYNTAVHASQSSGGPVDGLQIESNYNGVRDTAASRTNFATALAQVMDYFFTNYYGKDLRLSAPNNWNGGAGSWATGSNWAVTPPVSGNYLQFNGSGGAVNHNLPALTAGTGRVYALVFGPNATGSYKIFGNAVTLVAGITNSSPFPQTISNALTLSSNQTFTCSGGDLLLAGIISGTGGISKTGAGSLVLSGANTFTGPTTNLSGNLVVGNSSGSATGVGSVFIGAGATLSGAGTVGGPLTVRGIIAPGNPAGILTVGNGLDLGAGTYAWTLAANSADSPGTNFDQIVLSGGTLVLGSNSTLLVSFTNTASMPATNVPFWQASHSWKIISLGGNALNPGATGFASVSNGTFSVGKFVSVADAQNNVLLNYFPTPRPVISPALPGAGTTNVLISWSSVAGLNYQVQWSSNLTTGSWLPLGNILAAGTNTVFADTNAHPPSQRFYRIVIL